MSSFPREQGKHSENGGDRLARLVVYLRRRPRTLPKWVRPAVGAGVVIQETMYYHVQILTRKIRFCLEWEQSYFYRHCSVSESQHLNMVGRKLVLARLLVPEVHRVC